MTDPRKSGLFAPRFDWMQNTIREDPEEVIEILSGLLDAETELGRGMNGYHRSTAVIRAGETVARVLHGGPNGWPNVIASGAATDDVEPLMRSAWERREVTRFDSAQDFDEEGGYERVRAVLVGIAERSGMYRNELDSTRNGVRSRTFYLGSPTSRVRVRLYEKGRFEQQEGNADAPGDWFRMEQQVRPKGQAARLQAAQLDATEAWGLSRWTRELAEVVMGLDVVQIAMQSKREPDYMRAVRALERQYGATLQRAMAVEGSWDAVGRLLGVL